jgi:hypothetical protein
MKQELIDINSLTTVLLEFGENPIAAAAVPTFILSLIPAWGLEHCVGGVPLSKFGIFKRLFKLDLKSATGVMNKLADMVISFTMLHSNSYCDFVNKTVEDFLGELSMVKHAYVPFMKTLIDQAEAFAIGGCEMYLGAKTHNVLVRAYHWCAHVFGLDEETYAVMKYVEGFNNSSLLDLMESYISTPDEMISLLKVQFQKMYDEKRQPSILNNYTISTSGAITLKPPTYITDMRAIKDLCKYVFMKSSPSMSTTPSLFFVPIDFSVMNKPVVGKMTKNSIVVDQTTLPVTFDETSQPIYIPRYDYNASKEYVRTSFITPGGYRCMWLNMFGNKYDNNNTMLLLTTSDVKTRFQKYEFDSSPKPRLTNIKNAAMIKQQAAMAIPAITSARNLAENNLN